MGDDNDAQDQQNLIIQQQLALAQQAEQRANQLFAALVGPALSGNAPTWFRNMVRPSIESGFKGARENLVDFFGKSGQGISGIAAGPMANLYSEEAEALSDAEARAILGSIQLGSGAAPNLFNPGYYLQGAAGANAPLLPPQQGFPWGALPTFGYNNGPTINWGWNSGGWGGGW